MQQLILNNFLCNAKIYNFLSSFIFLSDHTHVVVGL